MKQFLKVLAETAHAVKVTPKLLSKVSLKTTEYVSADKRYDSDSLREMITQQSTKAVIPKKRNTTAKNDHMDWYIYKIRHLIENVFARLKHFRVIASKMKQFQKN